MSQKTLKCPKCGKDFTVTIYDSVNTKLNPELIKKVHNGSLFNVECPHCKTGITLNYPCQYHDMERMFMVKIDKRDNLVRFRIDLDNADASNPLSLMKNKYKLAGATNYPDWVTAISAFENNLDWRIVQLSFIYIKGHLYKDESAKITSIDSIVLDGSKNENGELLLRVFALSGKKDVSFAMPFIKDLYNALCEKHKKEIDKLNPFVFEEEDAMRFLGFIK